MRGASSRETGYRPLTPEYASPEQIRGEAITTASDVYQLGVLLYRLLTGDRPYRVSGTGETLSTAITQTQPRRPSDVAMGVDGASTGSSVARVRRQLRGDLDTIVLKALRKDPSRRYATALEMAEDVRRHLDGRPITARDESRLYRAGKFLQRNPWVAPVSAAVVALVGAYVFTLIQHGNELEAERNVSRDVQQAFVSFFTAPDSGDVGSRGGAPGPHDPPGHSGRHGPRASRPGGIAPPHGPSSSPPWRTCSGIWTSQERPSSWPGKRWSWSGICTGMIPPQVHEALMLVGQLHPEADSGRVLLERQLELSRALYGPSDPATAASLHALAEIDLRDGRLEDAVRRLSEAIDIYKATSAVHPRRLAEALAELPDNLEPLDRADEAVVAAREGHAILAREFGERHSQTAIAGARLAQALTSAGEYEDARTLYESSLDAMDAELGATHATTMSSRNNYAILLRLVGDLSGAEAIYRELQEAQRVRYGPAHSEVAASLQNMATAIKDQGRYDEAERLSFEAHDMFAETRGPDFFQTAFPLLTVSEIRLLRQDFVGAETVSRDALAILRGGPPAWPLRNSRGPVPARSGPCGTGPRPEARPLLEQGLEALIAGGRREVDQYREECAATLEAL